MLRRAFVDDTLAALDALARRRPAGATSSSGSSTGRPPASTTRPPCCRAARSRRATTSASCRTTACSTSGGLRRRDRGRHGRGRRRRRRPVDLRGRVGARPTVRRLRRHADRRRTSTARRSIAARSRSARTSCASACRRDRRLDRLRQRRRRPGRAGVRRRLAGRRPGRLRRLSRRAVRRRPPGRRASTTRASTRRARGPPWPDGARGGVSRARARHARLRAQERVQEVVLGLSGGVDSALVATIAVDALGADAVHALAMPSMYSCPGSMTDAEDVRGPPRHPARNRADHGRLPSATRSSSPTCTRSRAVAAGEPPGAHPGQRPDGAVEPIRLARARDRQQERVRRRLLDAVRRHGRRLRTDQGRAEDTPVRAVRVAQRGGAGRPPIPDSS